MKKKVIEFYIEKSDRFNGWQELVAKTSDGKEYIIKGAYCGGIPESYWEEVGEDTQQNKK